MAPCQGVLGSKLRNTQKKYSKNLIQNHLAHMLEIWHVAMPSGLLPSSNQGSSFQDRHGARRSQVGIIEIHSKMLKNLLQNQFAQMLVI